jgi:hypothetical protein
MSIDTIQGGCGHTPHIQTSEIGAAGALPKGVLDEEFAALAAPDRAVTPATARVRREPARDYPLDLVSIAVSPLAALITWLLVPKEGATRDFPLEVAARRRRDV